MKDRRFHPPKAEVGEKCSLNPSIYIFGVRSLFLFEGWRVNSERESTVYWINEEATTWWPFSVSSWYHSLSDLNGYNKSMNGFNTKLPGEQIVIRNTEAASDHTSTEASDMHLELLTFCCILTFDSAINQEFLGQDVQPV